MEYTDLIRMAAYFAVILVNREVANIFAIELILKAVFNSQLDGYQTSLIMASTYFMLASSPIQVNQNARMLIMQMGVLNWFAAADYAFYPYETIFYMAYPYLVNVIDTLIIWYLIPQGGRKRVGCAIRRFLLKSFRAVSCRITWL